MDTVYHKDHLKFCKIAWLYAPRSSSYNTRCKSVNDVRGESRLSRVQEGKTPRGISFLMYSAPLLTKTNLKKTVRTK